MVHICVITTGTSYNPNFSELFSSIDASTYVTVFSHSEKGLIDKIIHLHPPVNGIILTGSEYRIQNVKKTFLPSRIMELGIPVLGICFGFQWMVWNNKHGQIGTFPDKELHMYHKVLEITEPFQISKKKYKFSHHDFITHLPPSWKITLQNKEQLWMAYDPIEGHIGIQFHPEKHASSGKAFFQAWLIWIKKQKRN